MGQKKLKRFAELREFPNVYQYPEGMAGRWNEHFGNPNPITLELACGKGEYTVGLARLYPERNFIGVDVKGNRIWVGARTALREDLSNAAFLRTQIDRIAEYFAPGEIAEIWLTFPDPQLRISRAKKRLTHPKFLRLYSRFLAPEAPLHLKTDSPVLYAFTREVIRLYGLVPLKDMEDVQAQAGADPVLGIQTHYEKLDIAKSRRIHYLSFHLPAFLPDRDEELKNIIREFESDRGN